MKAFSRAVTPPEPESTEPSTSVMNGPPTEEEGTETFIGTDTAGSLAIQSNTTELTKSERANESDGEISSASENAGSASHSPTAARRAKKVKPKEEMEVSRKRKLSEPEPAVKPPPQG